MISIVIPTFERFLMTIECFEKVLKDERVSEIIIVDDASQDSSYSLLLNHFRYESKVKVFQNSFNLDCYYNKKRAVELASNEWCCLWDSDNVFDVDYLAAIFDYKWDENIIYTPSFAMPHFNFEAYSGLLITKENVAEYIDKPMFEVCLNACNYFVNRKSYLDVWEGSINPVTSDSVYFAYKWLESGRCIFIVPDLIYEHRVHSGSHYKNKNHLTPIGFHESVLANLRQLK